jgi:hypothetical protein
MIGLLSSLGLLIAGGCENIELMMKEIARGINGNRYADRTFTLALG